MTRNDKVAKRRQRKMDVSAGVDESASIVSSASGEPGFSKRTTQKLPSGETVVIEEFHLQSDPTIGSSYQIETIVETNASDDLTVSTLTLANELLTFAVHRLQPEQAEFANADRIKHSIQGFMKRFCPNASKNTKTESSIDPWISQADDGNEFANLLRELLTQIQSESFLASNECTAESLSSLYSAIHHCISAMATSNRFAIAVEKTSRRQIYQFAYGLTHEINNPLANIAARAQQLVSAVSKDADRRSLVTIVDQAMRAHEMLAEMMRVVQPEAIHPAPTDVAALVRSVANSYASEAERAMLRIECRLAPLKLFANVDAKLLSEALHSATKNAFEACRPNDSITLICQLLPAAVSDSAIEAAGYFEQQDRVRIAICDSGPGMSGAALEKAWDLYYSGREHGRGLGISLANVRRIVEAHGGIVWLRSQEQAGCSLEIRLPRIPDQTPQRRSLKV